jgi:hypothetical protein
LDPVTDELVTVAEAAKATNVSERAIRRYLSRPENTAQLRQVTRRTRTGTRQATVFPKSLLLSFLPHEDDDDEAKDAGEEHGANDGKNTGKNTGDTAAEDSATLAQDGDMAAERGGIESLPPLVVSLIAEKDARIADLVTALEREQAALEHERDAHKRAEVLHLNTQGELSELRRRAAELEAANAKLIALIPAAQTESGNADSGDITPRTEATVVQDDTSLAMGQETPTEGDLGVVNIGYKKRAGWWATLTGWVREN